VGRYIIRRLLIAIPTLLIISFVVYAILALAPGDPLSQFATNPNVPPEVRERIRESLGLNQPWHVRYVKWLLALIKGDFGYSFMSHLPVINLLIERLPNTLAVVGVAYILGVALAVPIGMISAVKRYSVFDHLATTFAFIGFSVPTFFTGLLFILLFSLKLHWFPTIYDSTLKVHDVATFWTQVKQMVMPVAVLTLFQSAAVARFMRSSMLDNLPLDYVRTARAKGLSERRILLKHALRCSLIPIVSLFGLDFGALVGGAALLTEVVFGLPGVGKLTFDALQNVDLPVIMGCVLYAAFFVVLANAVVDLLYAVLEPRVRRA
jgi:peptide/nickel transport system permease protein